MLFLRLLAGLDGGRGEIREGCHSDVGEFGDWERVEGALSCEVEGIVVVKCVDQLFADAKLYSFVQDNSDPIAFSSFN